MDPDDAIRAMVVGVRQSIPGAEIRSVPLSDGGPGFLESLAAASSPDASTVVRTKVDDPLGRPVEGRLLLSAGGEGEGAGGEGEGAAAESADACGLDLLTRDEHRPMITGTEGVGDLIRFAAARGVRDLALGLGGSATCDGGVGALRRLGWRFLDGEGEPLPRGGGALRRLERIEPPPPGSGLEEGDIAEIIAVADVRNPLLGPRGAARTFAPQKGAGPADVRQLEAGLERLAALAPGPGAADRSGAGAAGGLAFGCAAFLGARIVAGTAWVLERVGFTDHLRWAELVVTGEGAFDETSSMGKVTGAVLRRARRRGMKAVLACGRLEADPPEGVTAGDGGGEELDAEGLAALTGDLVAAAAGH